jgi:hypothetical protein
MIDLSLQFLRMKNGARLGDLHFGGMTVYRQSQIFERSRVENITLCSDPSDGRARRHVTDIYSLRDKALVSTIILVGRSGSQRRHLCGCTQPRSNDVIKLSANVIYR